MGDRQTIRISCNVRDFLPFSQIEEFQGNLKKRSKKEISKIITSILKFGFSFPFFVWKDRDLRGTQFRLLSRVFSPRIPAKSD